MSSLHLGVSQFPALLVLKINETFFLKMNLRKIEA